MKKIGFGSIVLALLAALFSPAYCAETKTNADPNAAVRKIMSGGQNSALAEVEKVNRLNNEAAVRSFTTAIQKNPKDAVLYARRGRGYNGLKDYDKAMPDFDKAIQLDPKNSEAYVGRAVIHLMKKNYDKCWEDVHKAESLGGKFWPTFMDALKTGSKRDK